MNKKRRIQLLMERVAALEELLDVQGETVVQQGEMLNEKLSNCKKKDNELSKTVEDVGNSMERTREFLANMSHEVRTPMNAIIGMTSLCMDSGIKKEQLRYLETLQKNAWSLLDIISSRLNESGSQSLQTDAADRGNIKRGDNG